jgi:hypothetical protein
MAKIGIKSVSNKKPKKNGEASKPVKNHNVGHVTSTKKVKPVNTKSNYGVKDNK